MTRYYCDYCDAFLTHDSSVVRKQHNAGFKHKANVKAYYLKFEPSFPALEAAESRLEYERQARGEPSHPPVGVRYRGPRAGLGEICAPGPGYRLPPGVSLPFNARGGPPGPRFGPGGPMRPGEWGSGPPPHGNFAPHVGGPGASHAGPGLAHRGPVGAAGPLPSKPTADKMALDGGNAGTTAQGGNQEHKANAPGDASAPAADHATASKPAGASGPESSAVPAENPSEAPAASAAKLPAEAAPVAADSDPPAGDASTAEPPAEAAPASPAPAAETA